ncbi:MAG: LemA family protein [Bryobacterales bacterium]|nr:LemA family protein [Bryobacterales bacterium]
MKATTVIGAAAALLGAYVAGDQMASARAGLAGQQAAIHEAWLHVDAVPRRCATMRWPGRRWLSHRPPGDAFLAARSTRGRIAANAALETAVARLHPLLEERPGRLPHPALTSLRDDLTHSENEVAVERRKYNDAVQKYNTSIELFPNNVAASLFGFARDDAYFQTEPAKRDAP